MLVLNEKMDDVNLVVDPYNGRCSFQRKKNLKNHFVQEIDIPNH